MPTPGQSFVMLLFKFKKKKKQNTGVEKEEKGRREGKEGEGKEESCMKVGAVPTIALPKGKGH